MKNIEVKQIPELLKSKLIAIFKHAKFIFIVIVILLNSFLVFEINRLINKEPTGEQLSVQQEIIKRPKIDQDTISKIEQLEDQNVGVQALFKKARNNPFQD